MSSEPLVEESPFKGQTGLRRVWNALNYSLSGLRAAYLKTGLFHSQEGFLLRHQTDNIWIPVTIAKPPAGAEPIVAAYPAS